MISRVAKNRTTERRKKTYTKPCYNTIDIYRDYKSEVKEKDIKFKITAKQHKDICHEYNKLLADEILNHSQIVKLPFRLGEIGIRKRKMSYKFLKLDFDHFNKTGEKTYHLNLHSNEWFARWHWKKKNCLVPNKGYYSFTAADTLKKALAKIMKTPGGHTRFYED